MNTAEVQQALRSIGWPIAVDGSYGDVTHQAVADFQRGFTPFDLLIDGMAGPQTQHALNISLYFNGACGDGFFYREFKSKGNGWIKVHRELVRGLVEYRKRYGPTRIVSGYRDPAHNAAVGGAKNSQHLYGNGVDLDPKASVNAVRNLRKFSGIGIQRATGLVRHVDVRHMGPNTTHGSLLNPTVWYYG